MLQELWPARKQLAERGHTEDGVKQGSEGRAGADLLDNLFVLTSLTIKMALV